MAHFGVLVSDVNSCQCEENGFVAENRQRQETKWQVEFSYTALVAVNGKTIFPCKLHSILKRS